jgi:hypothetical protein
LLKWKYRKTEETFLEYKRAAISMKNKLREIKQKHWKTLCEGIDTITNPSYIWDRMKRLKCRYKAEKEHEYKELVESAKTTFEKLCSGVDEQMQTPAFHHDNQDPFLDLEYTIQELHFAVKILRVQSSPGWDGIGYFIIRKLPNEAIEILLEIYNDILRARVFLDDWKKYTIFFIPKKDKTNIRHIFIASCVCKVLEHIS